MRSKPNARDWCRSVTLVSRAVEWPSQFEARQTLEEYALIFPQLLALDDLLLRLAPVVEAIEATAGARAAAFVEVETIFNSSANADLRWQIKHYDLPPAPAAPVSGTDAPRPVPALLNDGQPKESDAELARRNHAEAITPTVRNHDALKRQLSALQQELARSDGAASVRTRIAGVEAEIEALTRSIEAHAAAPK
jgi:hypothetical protein